MIGGRLFKHSVVTVGAAALERIARIRADLYFMGVTGVDTKAGLSTGDLEEAHVKRALMAAAAETVCSRRGEARRGVAARGGAAGRGGHGGRVGCGAEGPAGGWRRLGLDVVVAAD